MSASSFLPSCVFYIKSHLKISYDVIFTQVVCELHLSSCVSCKHEVNMREREVPENEGEKICFF